MRKNLQISLFISLVALTSCVGNTGIPDPDSEAYQQAVSDFYVSLAASQTDEALFAYNKMNDVAELFPNEPAAWANLGVYAMRQNNYELASEYFARARDLSSDNADILFQSGLLESRAGNIDQAIQFFREGVTADPQHLRLTYALVTELERQDDTGNADEITAYLGQMYTGDPGNLVVLYELIRFTAKAGDTGLMQTYVEELAEYSQNWPSSLREQFENVRNISNEGLTGEISLELAFLRNGLDELPGFSSDLNQIRLAPNEIGYLIPDFLWLPRVRARAADPDLGMTFSRQMPDSIPSGTDYVKSVTLLDDLPPIAIYIHNGVVHIDESVNFEYPAESADRLLHVSSIAEVDYNSDFRNDLALAGSIGFRLYRQNDDNTFTDVTGELNLSDSITNASYEGVWTADIDLDGDLDIILSESGRPPVVIRNNGDGSFERADLFTELSGIVDFMWADLNYDGMSDAVFLDSEGVLHIYLKPGNGEMVKQEHLPAFSGVYAFTIADTDADGNFNIVGLRDNGLIFKTGYDSSSGSWGTDSLVHDSEAGESLLPGSARILSSDMDNNGRLDLLVSTRDESRIWLGDDQGMYHPLNLNLPGNVYSVVDIDGDSRLDLLGLSNEGNPYQLINTGTESYGSSTIRARASGTEGDGRINSFGIGGEMEVRSGLLYQKQLITSPNVHFGLGTHSEADLLRIIWPNGSVQAEFAELGMGSTIFNEQILKGSCPWLFAYDGEHMHFVTDILWRSPLGLRINALETAGVAQTLDRVRIPGDMLRPHNGIYDLRITAELWETHYFDHIKLLAVDHPEGSEIVIDERFSFPSPDLRTRIIEEPKPVKKILDDRGKDVTRTAGVYDQNYLQAFEKTRYQGLAEEHYVEVELGEEPPNEGPLWLVASGWLRPTDSSLNVAISQGLYDPPKGLRVEVSDGSGNWIELHDDYGIPAGKLKTILLDLTGVFPDSSDRRIRLHTTSEIYWDAIQWAEGLTDDNLREKELTPVSMELQYRGYSDWSRADSVSPGLPDYNIISGTAPRWNDLTGHHTRFGDVSELLEGIDDRYVIMNSGDELVLRFSETEPPPEGWTRSYVFVSDGWEKDGDYNTEASATVLPLPYHGQQHYTYSTGQSLYDDPVYNRHRYDWVDYHTRYITPVPFRQALQFDSQRGSSFGSRQ